MLPNAYCLARARSIVSDPSRSGTPHSTRIAASSVKYVAAEAAGEQEERIAAWCAHHKLDG